MDFFLVRQPKVGRMRARDLITSAGCGNPAIDGSALTPGRVGSTDCLAAVCRARTSARVTTLRSIVFDIEGGTTPLDVRDFNLMDKVPRFGTVGPLFVSDQTSPLYSPRKFLISL